MNINISCQDIYKHSQRRHCVAAEDLVQYYKSVAPCSHSTGYSSYASSIQFYSPTSLCTVRHSYEYCQSKEHNSSIYLSSVCVAVGTEIPSVLNTEKTAYWID
jgi:hypothetical protein